MAQTIMIFMLAIGLNVHVIIIPLLLHVAGRDAWLAVCLSSPLAFVAMIFMQYVIRASKQQHIGLWLREQLPAWLANALLCLMGLPLFVAALVTFRVTISWVENYQLPTTPGFVLVFTLAALCFYCTNAGIASIAIVSGLLLPVVVVLGFFVGTSNLPHKDYSLLFPLLEHGWNPVFQGMIYSASGFSELFVLLCVQHYIKTEIRYSMLAANVLILLVLTLGPLCGAIVEYGPHEAASLRYPAFEEWRLITFGHYLEHADFLGIYQWASGAFIRISFTLFLVVEIFGITKGRKRTWLLALLFGAVSVLTMILASDVEFFYFLQQFASPACFYCVCAIALLLVIIAWRSKRREANPK